MGGATTILERIDEVLERVEPDPTSAFEECYLIVDALPEEGINILPTAIDEADMCIACLAERMLPPVARRIGLPTAALLGQRSLHL